jgi:endonuclease/exonuclease/phosphatase family metal-dependent hydrolase
VSENIEVTSYRTGPNIGSDHLPIAVTLKITQ